jgi:YegS/Rv2252/BmrU family lipid kinase
MRVKVILNPYADLGRGIQKKEIIISEGEKRGGLDLVVTDRPGHACQLAHEAVGEGYDVIVAAGGDGTVHEVVNGMLQDGRQRTELGVIPIGTGNDFAYAMNIPQAIPIAVEHIFRGHSRSIDLAEVVDDRGVQKLFANNLGIGFDANVVIRVQAVTRLHGFTKYLWGVLKTLALDFRPFRFDIRFDNEKLIQDVLFVAFGIGPRHGGGFMLTPNSLHDDNRIDTCTVRPMSRLRALMLLNSAVQGTHVQKSEVTMRQSKHIEISCRESLPIHIDGEIFAYPQDNVHRMTITSLPTAIQVLV